MAYPVNTSSILQFLGFIPEINYAVLIKSSGVVLNWITGLEPTEQEITDAGNDLTTVDGQVYSQWLAEHGGDITLTSRREAKEALDQATSRLESLIRAIALITMDEINILRQQFNDSTAEVPQLTNTTFTQRTGAQIKTAIRNKIDSGDADT